jgi:hypothetical protein
MTAPANYELTRISVTHNAIADWLIANPGKGQMQKCAAVFEITPAWLSTLVHQDAFKALLKVKQGTAFEEVVIPLRHKMMGVAHRSVERLGEIVETTKDDRLVREIAKDMSQNLGFSPSLKGPTVNIDNSTNNHLTVNQEALAKAREKQSKHYGRHLENSTEPRALPPSEQTEELPNNREFAMVEASDLRAECVNSSEELYGVAEEGGEVRGPSK